MNERHLLRSEVLHSVTEDNTVPLEAGSDAFKVMGSDNYLTDCKTIDTRCRTSAHCDHVQIIPTGLEPNAQYFGAISYNNQIIGGGLESNGSMQGIFSSDGGHSNLYIADQVIDTGSEHEITISGFLSGTFLNNKHKDGTPLKITLEPMRIGGGLPNAFYVSSFKDHTYEPINTDQEIRDYRKAKKRRNALYVDNFDLNLFREISESNAEQYRADLEHTVDIGKPSNDATQRHFDYVMQEYDRRNELSSTKDVIKLERFTSNKNTTISRLYLNGEFLCHVLEDAHHDKKIKHHTRIPAGTYKVGMRREGGFNARYSKRFPEFHQGMLELKDVPNFKYILIHVGNTHEDTSGCLLVGKWNKSGNYVRESAVTYKCVYLRLVEQALRGNLVITIEDND